MKFFGSADKTNAFRTMLSSERHKWSLDKLVRENLEAIFQISFPTKPSADAVMNAGIELECGICYTYSVKDTSAAAAATAAATTGGGGRGSSSMMTSTIRTASAASSIEAGSNSNSSSGSSGAPPVLIFPEVHCDNVKCSRVYHHRCLVDWLKSLPSTRISFHTLFGCCPYCQDPLCVKAI